MSDLKQICLCKRPYRINLFNRNICFISIFIYLNIYFNMIRTTISELSMQYPEMKFRHLDHSNSSKYSYVILSSSSSLNPTMNRPDKLLPLVRFVCDLYVLSFVFCKTIGRISGRQTVTIKYTEKISLIRSTHEQVGIYLVQNIE